MICVARDGWGRGGDDGVGVPVVCIDAYEAAERQLVVKRRVGTHSVLKCACQCRRVWRVQEREAWKASVHQLEEGSVKRRQLGKCSAAWVM